MPSFSMCVVLGHLGQDPELKYTASGTPVATLSVATSKRRKDSNGTTIAKTVWHGVKVWNKTAEFVANNAQKGSVVLVEGEIDKEEYEDREGRKAQKTYIVARNVQILSKWKGKEDNKSTSDDDFIPEP